MKTWELHISGRVQGVGFRPTVYRLACASGLAGEVSNGPAGLRVYFNAPEFQARQFQHHLLANLPPRALVTAHTLQATAWREFPDFSITDSTAKGKPDLLVAPDFAICSDCREELHQSQNRRFRYPFTTCTNCGPRYAITTALPYDRERTTVAPFAMCPSCRAEYADPTNRRHFSQTNSCPDCGITLTLLGPGGARTQDAVLVVGARLLRQGRIVAVKGIAGYLLCCDALHAPAVEELRRRKQRPDKPFAVLFPDLPAVQPYARVSPLAAAELSGPAAPIVLLPKHLGTAAFPPCSDSAYVGAMLPSSPLLTLLSHDFGGPLVATSANLSGEPILTDGQEDQVLQLADFVLTHDLAIAQAQDDSLVRFTEDFGQRIVLRRGRGLAPALAPPAAQPVGPDLLACGADLKSAVALRANGRIFVTSFLGDLADFGSHQRFSSTLVQSQALLDARPTAVLTDLHPAYFSHALGQEYAEKHGLNLHRVQHHEAHFAALLGEHDLLDTAHEILGVVWDGTGLGHDGHVWGGEFFRFDQRGFRRVAHLAYVPHLGGDQMSRDLRYAALAFAGHLPPAEDVLRTKLGTLPFNNLWHLRARAKLRTSSVGRLFDAVACLLGLMEQQTYEGQAAALLEQAAREGLAREPNLLPYDQPELWENLLADLPYRAPTVIAARFHLTLVDWVKEIAEAQKVRAIGFSGGVFQNALLLDLLRARLPEYQLYFHQQLSPNDENIAYGQIIHYALTQRTRCAAGQNQENYVLSYPG
ncbi:carbamoyltransferase HypF [Neolewinella lacunae]|uniref:Carbamoyltransferase n=1 Tax=Neolewinella lacunae TaxID=1517758 RepID=A0A923PPI5_9BACT|nr:carbamoyltransferase HypF [Neolewinella lacunae]MBC6995104.1 carbamoyltransferase HypF [Neolewinella lacunae]MDN3634054.1 carbamoyltransferase HypF [Neolewinella lacunae]